METKSNSFEGVILERMESSSIPIHVPIVFSWGRSDFGNLLKKPGDDQIDGVYQFQTTRTIMNTSSNIYHSAAVSSTGELYTCGENYDGQVAPKTSSGYNEEECKRPRILDLFGGQQRIISVSCGLTHTVCVAASGCAISFGGNESGQLGHSPKIISNVPPKIVTFQAPLTSATTGSIHSNILIRKVSCGDLFTIFLTTAGEVYGCGSASYLGNSLYTEENNMIMYTAQRVDSLTGTYVTDITTGAEHTLILTNTNDIYTWGSNIHCQLGYNNDTSSASTPLKPSSGIYTLSKVIFYELIFYLLYY